MRGVRSLRFLAPLLLAASLVFSPIADAAHRATFFIGSNQYIVDGQPREMDVAAFIQDGRAFVPVRFLAYALGVAPEDIIWSDLTRTVTLSKDGVIVTVAVGGYVLYVNDRRVEMDVAPVIVPPGRVCLPARFVAEAFGYRVSWDAATQAVTVEESASVSRRGGAPDRRPRVVVDPGHGGRDPGAVAGPLREADLALDLTLKAARGLERQGVSMRLTRQEDRDVSLPERVALANRTGADLFLSVHCNAASNPEARGFESYVHPAAWPRTREIARTIHERLAAFLNSFGVPDRGLKEADFYVLRETRCPAVLLECLFLTNAEDARLLGDPAWRSRLAAEIAQAVVGALAA